MRRITYWYPKAWRERYGEEFEAMLADQVKDRPHSYRRTVDIVKCRARGSHRIPGTARRCPRPRQRGKGGARVADRRDPWSRRGANGVDLAKSLRLAHAAGGGMADRDVPLLLLRQRSARLRRRRPAWSDDRPRRVVESPVRCGVDRGVGTRQCRIVVGPQTGV